MEIGDNAFLIKLPSMEVKDRALAIGHWVVGGQLLLVEDWHPLLQPTSSNLHVVRLWVTLPNLPSLLRSRKSLITIARRVFLWNFHLRLLRAASRYIPEKRFMLTFHRQ